MMSVAATTLVGLPSASISWSPTATSPMVVQPVGVAQGSVEGERLTHTGSGRDDDHLAGVEAVGDLVEFGEAGGHTEGDAAAAGDGVDLVHRGLQQLLEGDEVLGGAALGDLVDLGLRAVDHLGDVLAVGAGVAVLDDAGAGVDEAAQDRLLRDDLGVEAGVGGGGDGLGERDQVGRPTDPAEFASAVQLGGRP